MDYSKYLILKDQLQNVTNENIMLKTKSEYQNINLKTIISENLRLEDDCNKLHYTLNKLSEENKLLCKKKNYYKKELQILQSKKEDSKDSDQNTVTQNLKKKLERKKILLENLKLARKVKEQNTIEKKNKLKLKIQSMYKKRKSNESNEFKLAINNI